MGNFSGFQKSEDYYLHPRLGQIKRIQKQDGPQLIEHKALVDSEESMQKWAKAVKTLSTQGCEGVLFLPKTHYFQRIGFCGQSGQVFMLFDDFMFSLADEIKNRRLINRGFPEPALWQFLYRLVKVERSISEFKLAIGNVKPQNIIVNEDGQWRILSQHSAPSLFSTAIELDLYNSRYYSPEQLSNNRLLGSEIHRKEIEKIGNGSKQEQKQKYDKNVAEMYSIGLTMLEISTLSDMSQVYAENSIKHDLIQQHIVSLEGKYHPSLVSFIWSMLRPNPHDRITASQLLRVLQPHHDQIENHQTFNIQGQLTNDFPNAELSPLSRIEAERAQSKVNLMGKKWAFKNFFPFLRGVSEQQEQFLGSKSSMMPLAIASK